MIQVTESLWRGPRPYDLADLQSQGFKSILSVEQGWFEAFHDDPYEHEKPIDFGMILSRIRCSDIVPPSEDQVLGALRIMDSPNKTYIHCLTGVDRTGFMCAAYRMRKENWSFNSAYAEWVNLGRHWWFDWWKYALKNWEKCL